MQTAMDCSLVKMWHEAECEQEKDTQGFCWLCWDWISVYSLLGAIHQIQSSSTVGRHERSWISRERCHEQTTVIDQLVLTRLVSVHIYRAPENVIELWMSLLPGGTFPAWQPMKTLGVHHLFTSMQIAVLASNLPYSNWYSNHFCLSVRVRSPWFVPHGASL